MQPGRISAYLRNCFWLMLPPLAISGLWSGLLPPIFQPDLFWQDIAAIIAVPETVSRILVTGLPLLMPLALDTPRQRVGMAVYALGLLAYGLAWWPVIVAPGSSWSTSLVGFAAPAYTPALWLAGIGLIGTGKRTGWIGWAYAVAAVIFLVCHNLHTFVIHARHLPG